MEHLVFGLDIGGTGIKGGVVNLKTGRMETERLKRGTPRPALPEDIAIASHELIQQFDWKGPIGVGFPAIIKKGVCHSATNIDRSWIGTNVAELLKSHTGNEVRVINDADAAALCEIKFGAAKDHEGLVMVTTLGTGVGCGLMYDGQLVPNCELGVSYLPNGIMLEKHCSNAVRMNENLDWPEFGERLSEGLAYMDRLLSVDLFVLGGGVSKSFDAFGKYLNPQLNVVPAAYQNEAGCIGAAMLFG